MKAYISTKTTQGGFVSFVVSEQDYHDRGPHAHSFRVVKPTMEEAETTAHAWAVNNGYEACDLEEVAGT